MADLTPPTLTVLGKHTADDPFVLLASDTELFGIQDPGATALDIVDGDVSFAISASINNVSGRITVLYTVRDAAGNEATAVREVDVVPSTVKPALGTIALRLPPQIQSQWSSMLEAEQQHVTVEMVRALVGSSSSLTVAAISKTEFIVDARGAVNASRSTAASYAIRVTVAGSSGVDDLTELQTEYNAAIEARNITLEYTVQGKPQSAVLSLQEAASAEAAGSDGATSGGGSGGGSVWLVPVIVVAILVVVAVAAVAGSRCFRSAPGGRDDHPAAAVYPNATFNPDFSGSHGQPGQQDADMPVYAQPVNAVAKPGGGNAEYLFQEISRVEAEAAVDQAGGAAGTYLIRAKGDLWVLTLKHEAKCKHHKLSRNQLSDTFELNGVPLREVIQGRLWRAAAPHPASVAQPGPGLRFAGVALPESCR